MGKPIEFYKERAELYKEQLSGIQNTYRLVSFFRLLSFVAFLIAGYQWLSLRTDLLLIISLLSIVVFVILIRIALKLNDRKALTEKLLFINENEIHILRHEPSGFNDAANLGTNEDYTGDLDIFGPGSLFQLLNRTTTYHGTRELAGLLTSPILSKEMIEMQQQAIKTLSPQKELRQMITAHGLLHQENEGNLYDIMSWLQLPPILHGKNWLNIFRFALPVLNVAALVFYLYTDNYLLLTLGIIISWSMIGAYAKRIHRQHGLLGKKQTILEQYASVLTYFSKVDAGNSQLLQREQGVARSAHDAIKQLSRLASFFDQRLNFLVNLFLNSFFMYDIQCLWALENWKKRHAGRFNEWIHCVGSIETLNSLATFAFNYPSYQYPTINENIVGISTEQLAHPLIPEHERVANDMTIGKDERLVLVTGSNMSGKTTFLRTLGVNLLLAQCGAPVCAKRFEFTPMNIRTSIRVNDSLQEHTSYFMAELKRLQQIIKHLEKSKSPTLVMIDEILRGTNSEDKTHGSEQFIKKLLQYNCLTLFATHDLALSVLETALPAQVRNYCFESVIRDGELLFDYTLRQGVAKNKNASFLMQKMEII
jgi:DNA mismatch repair ATPase MutS